MLCTSCGKENVAVVSFCEFCGVDLGKAVSADLMDRASSPANQDAAAVAAAAFAGAGKTLIQSLTLGEKFTAAGAAAAIVGFFLPFLSSPDLSGLLGGVSPAAGLASALTHISYSLLDCAKLLGAIYFILLAAIGSGILFYFSRKASISGKLLMSGFQILIGSLLGPVLLVSLMFVPLVQSVAGMGYWLSALGFSAIAAGGLITVAQLGKRCQ